MSRNRAPLAATLLAALAFNAYAAPRVENRGRQLPAQAAPTRPPRPATEAQPTVNAAHWKLKLTLRGHTGAVYSASFYPDGRRVATSGDDESIRIWDLMTGRLLRKIERLGGTVSDVAVSHDGRMLASCTDGDGESKVQLRDARTFLLLRTLVGHRGGVFEVVFSPDGRVLASGGRDKTVKLWDTATGRLIRTLSGHDDAVTALAFTPDGQVLASASGEADNTVRLWDVSTGRTLHTLAGHDDWVTSVAFTPDGATLASGSRDRSVILWNTRTGEKLKQLRQPEMVYEIEFSPDGKVFAEAGGGGQVRLHDARTGKLLFTIKAHTEEINEVKFSPRGSLLLSASYDATVKLWEPTPMAATGNKPRAKWME
jgi:WD40 repeat protein